jgi:hypothetical protein
MRSERGPVSLHHRPPHWPVLEVVLGAILALLGMLIPAIPALATSSLSDVTPDSAYYAAIQGLAARQIVSGYGDGRFGPQDFVTRAQFAKMIVLGMGYPVTVQDHSTFKDTPPADPSDPRYPGSYVAVANLNGVIRGYSEDNTFRFYNDVTRQQVITMVVRAAGVNLEEPPSGWTGLLDYSDPTHGSNLRKAEYNHLLDGLVGLSGSWDPGQDALRGECAQILWNLLADAIPSSGIEGEVRIGPISPVSRPGEDNSRPYSAEILIEKVGTSEVAAKVTSSADGRFRTPLPPGRYLIEPKQGRPYPIVSTQEVRVPVGEFVHVRVDYDSGIR